MIASLLLGNLALLILNLPLAGMWAKILDIPPAPLYAGIAVISTISIFAMSQSVFDLIMLFGFGIIGYGMKRFGFPTSPLVVGLILGPLAEQQFRRAMTLSNGDPMTFLQHPISAGILVTAVILVGISVLLKRTRRAAAALSSESSV
jgi:putative tricarboxylic transport membrane protein